jgi:hypothetical protein
MSRHISITDMNTNPNRNPDNPYHNRKPNPNSNPNPNPDPNSDSNNFNKELHDSILNVKAVLQTIKSIPDSISAAKMVNWLKSDILPYLHQFTVLSIYSKNSPSDSDDDSNNNFNNDLNQGLDNGLNTDLNKGLDKDWNDDISIAYLIAAELCKRARLSEEIIGHPFDALLAAELAVTLASSCSNPNPNSNLNSNHNSKPNTNSNSSNNDTNNSHHNTNSNISINNIKKLLINLQIQAVIWRSWDGDRPSLADIEEIGLHGLVGERLWGLEDLESLIVSDISSVIAPIISQFGGDLDRVLSSWVVDAVENRVVLIDIDDDYGSTHGKYSIVKNSDNSKSDNPNLDSNPNPKSGSNSGSNNDSEKKDKDNKENDEITCTLSRLISVVR